MIRIINKYNEYITELLLDKYVIYIIQKALTINQNIIIYKFSIFFEMN